MPRTTVSVSPLSYSTSTEVISPVMRGVGTPSWLTVTVTGVASCKPPGRRISSGIPTNNSLNWDGTNIVLSTSTATN
jgi:hypothetical protein